MANDQHLADPDNPDKLDQASAADALHELDGSEPDKLDQDEAISLRPLHPWRFAAALIIAAIAAFIITATVTYHHPSTAGRRVVIRSTLDSYAAESIAITGPTPCALMSREYLAAFTHDGGLPVCQGIFQRQRQQFHQQHQVSQTTLQGILAGERRQIAQAKITLVGNAASVAVAGQTSASWTLRYQDGHWQFNSGDFAGSSGSAALTDD
jgi:hypothetical protein